VRPSLLILGFDCAFCAVEPRRTLPTVPADRPVAAAIIRLDHCGCDPMIRSAAVIRSVRVSGSSWMMFIRTASTNASSPDPWYYERLPEHAEAMVKWTMIGLMTRRLAPAPGRRPWQKTRAA
jgi:hypothetical protein